MNCGKRLTDHGEFFDPRWDKIFTELPIYQGGKEMRIDRLMLDTRAREALIVDFKTGKIHEPEQLERYREVLSQLPVLKGGAYRIEISYLQF